MTIATAGTGGFGADSSATGPNAGYDPVMKFRKKVKDKKALTPENKLKESKENPSMPSRLFQYKVSIPEVGETIIYANSSAELMQKLRLLLTKQRLLTLQMESSWKPEPAFQFQQHHHQKL